MSLEKPGNTFLKELMQKWQELQNVPKVFSYQLEVTNSKFLPGKYKFYSEYNPKRSALRRPPQTIISLDPQFDEGKFNFKNVAPEEILMKLKFQQDMEISFIINNSPLTKYHTLICPDVEKSLPQRITLDALRFSVDFLLSLEGNRYFRIGYNSPGALASVNHLHLHLMLIENELHIYRSSGKFKRKLQYLAEPDVYRLAASMPTEALCYLINAKDSSTNIEWKLSQLYKFLIWLCDNNMPHNIFMTPITLQTVQDSEYVLKIFVYVREKICIVKDLYKCNIGFGELSGYAPFGSKELYDSITENDLITQIKSESGQIYAKVYKYFKESSQCKC